MDTMIDEDAENEMWGQISVLCFLLIMGRFHKYNPRRRASLLKPPELACTEWRDVFLGVQNLNACAFSDLSVCLGPWGPRTPLNPEGWAGVLGATLPPPPPPPPPPLYAPPPRPRVRGSCSQVGPAFQSLSEGKTAAVSQKCKILEMSTIKIIFGLTRV